MTQAMQAVRPVLTSIAAHLYVRDVSASADFFVKKLGFSVDFLYGDPPFYGEVRRDQAILALRLVKATVFAGDIRSREDLLSATVTLASAAEIEALFREFEAGGVVFHQRLRKEEWGAQTFIVADLDGNLILFASPAE